MLLSIDISNTKNKFAKVKVIKVEVIKVKNFLVSTIALNLTHIFTLFFKRIIRIYVFNPSIIF